VQRASIALSAQRYICKAHRDHPSSKVWYILGKAETLMSKKQNKGGESGPSGRSGSAHRGGNNVGAGAQSGAGNSKKISPRTQQLKVKGRSF